MNRTLFRSSSSIPEARQPLQFYKCRDCLTPFTALETVHLCACGGDTEFMGHVRGQHLVTKEMKCPCDTRCTHATGPTCECQCEGENHGTGRLVEVETVGAYARSKTVDAEAFQRALEFREGLAECRKLDALLWTAVREQMQQRVWLPRQIWQGQFNSGKALQKIRESKLHKKRMQMIKQFMEGKAG